MSTFNTTRLANHRVLVEGDGNQQILDSTQFDDLLQHEAVNDAEEVFNDQVASFFAPLTEAAEALAHNMAQAVDPAFIYVIDEGQDHTEGKGRVVIDLDHDTVVLRLIDSGDTSRLVWVAGAIEILEYTQVPPLEFNDPENPVTAEFDNRLF